MIKIRSFMPMLAALLCSTSVMAAPELYIDGVQESRTVKSFVFDGDNVTFTFTNDEVKTASVDGFTLKFNDETAIQKVSTEVKEYDEGQPRKVIRNGQIVIGKYNVLGQQVGK